MRLRADFGGTIGHEIYASIVVTGDGNKVVMDKHKVMDITNHYKAIVAGNRLPLWAKHLEVTIELIRKPGASSCKMVADTVSLIVSRIEQDEVRATFAASRRGALIVLVKDSMAGRISRSPNR